MQDADITNNINGLSLGQLYDVQIEASGCVDGIAFVMFGRPFETPGICEIVGDAIVEYSAKHSFAEFTETFRAFSEMVHETAVAKGWWDDDSESRVPGVAIALMHSELSEALEAFRAGNPPDDKVPLYSGVEAELADVVIRIMDFAAANGHDVAGAIFAKAEYNKTRPIKHGGKEF